MYLSKLDIIGFKSFAQKTNLRFTNGISAIVGPNGCGKSNIVDAIRWVLGEQKTSVLRSDVMENVIFNGTKNRKPLGMAEVALTIENNKNILPSEYNEVVITRRLFRSGESEYLLNNTKCRLRDIIDLFMDTGLGSDSYSVIELKMVEAILSGRGDDRRGLFEEAAGIKKYKLQRKEATKKLNDVLSDLLRVNDLIEEVRKNVNSLQRHAQKTRRYNVLNEEFRTVDTKLSAFQFKNFNAVADILKSEIQTINEDKIKNESQLTEKNNEHSKMKADYQEVDSELNIYLENELEIEKNIGHSKQNIAVSNERLIRINDDEVRLKQEIENITQKLSTTGTEINSTKDKITELETLAQQTTEELNTANQEVEICRQNTVNARNEVSQLSQNLQSAQTNINNHKSNIHRSSDKKQAFENKIAQFDSEKNNLQNNIEQIEGKLENSAQKINDFAAVISEKENFLTVQQEERNRLQAELDNCKQEISKLTSERNHKRSSYDFLHNLVDTSETAKFLLNSAEWSNETEKLMLSESIAVDENLQNAISVIFSNFSDYFVTNSKENAQKAISLLKHENKGKAGFICLDSIPNVAAPNPLNGDGIIGWFSEIIRADDQIRNAVRLIFDGLLFVENAEIGLQLLRNSNAHNAYSGENYSSENSHSGENHSGENYNNDNYNNSNDNFHSSDNYNNNDSKNNLQANNLQAIITRDGEYIHKSGAIRGGSIAQGETARFGKLEKMNKINEEIEIIEREIKRFEENKNNIEQQLSQINLQDLTNEIRSLDAEKRDFENNIAQLNLEKNRLQNDFELIEKNCENYKNDIAEIENEIEVSNQKIVELQFELEKIQIDYEAKKTHLEGVENHQKDIENKAKEIEISLVKTNSEISSTVSDLKRLTQQEQNYRNSIEGRKLELIENEKLRSDLNLKIEQTNIELENLTKTHQETKNKCDFLSQKKKSLKEQLDQIENEISDFRKFYDKIVENIHQKEVKLSETNTWLRNIVLNFQNNYQLDISSTVIEIPDDFSEDEAKQAISDLKQKLQNLGSINFAAIEEYESEKERLEFLEKQVSDLTSAEKTLRETIEEINQTAERNFINTFSKIRLNFQNLFRKLFNEEGEADIKFDENNPLESEINIVARPPNKRPNSIEQLSGGEKTLTAIALLFAIYLVKPSPFCILDEVDAPLDDANVRRFLSIIRDFSKDTQFLVVTHNKTTMTAADTLYGVTMQEPGISKTASVRIDEIDG